ncbi:MAG: type II secretion system GspH family protein [Verrucomicrobiota bacterium]|nr:type II secretion system GspH family protein [Verrucomicrobiota bacterium]
MSKRANAFTIVELLIVMAIIIILAGLVLGTSGYVQKKGSRSRAEAEIAAMWAACESYTADNGIYPTDQATTDQLDPTKADPSTYASANLALYKAISGDVNANRQPTGKSYIGFKPNQLNPPSPSASTVTSIRDPFGNPYGYSTMKASDPSSPKGYNPTFDLWSTGGTTTGDQNQWIKNW